MCKYKNSRISTSVIPRLIISLKICKWARINSNREKEILAEEEMTNLVSLVIIAKIEK